MVFSQSNAHNMTIWGLQKKKPEIKNNVLKTKRLYFALKNGFSTGGTHVRMVLAVLSNGGWYLNTSKN